MKVIVRLDVSKSVGTGHLRRMLNLKNSTKYFDFLFIINTDDEKNSIFRDLNLVFIDNESEFLNLLRIELYDLIILDLLRYKDKYIENIKNEVDKPLVSFHEYNDYSEFSDLIVNYNFFKDFEKTESRKFLAGPKYIIFPDEIEKFKNPKMEDYIFVSFGGSDPSGLTELFVSKVASQMKNFSFLVHIGSFNKAINKDLSNVKYIYQPKNLFKYMASAKLAVSSAGNTMYELIYFKIPAVVISHNAHQDEFATSANKLNCIKYMGLASSFDEEKIMSTIKNLYANNVNSCKYEISSNGKKNIIYAIKRLIS